MADQFSILADLLLELEKQLRVLEKWSDASPSPEELASTMPFAADRVTVEQWLQWIFIPRIKFLIETGGELPASCDIHPYAEESWKHDAIRVKSLLHVLLKIDRHLSRA